MAIEITRESPEFKPIEIDCKSCTAGLKINALSDISGREGDQREPEPSLWINCPVCSNRITIPQKGFTDFQIKQITRAHSSRLVDSYYDK